MELKKPSVSKILEMIFWDVWEDLPPFILQKAIDKGNCIHSRSEHYIKYYEKLECICKKPVKSHNELFKRLLNDLNNLDFNSILIPEQRLETQELVGIIDLQVIKDNKILIIDFKTNSKLQYEKWNYQLYMYCYLVNKSWDINWNKYELEIWHYNVNHKEKSIYKIPKPKNEEIKEIQEAIKVYWKEQIENDK